MLVLAAISWFWLVRGHYTQRRPFWDETRDVVIAMLVLAVVDAALMFMLKSPFSRLWWWPPGRCRCLAWCWAGCWPDG